jgi:predicted nucleotidyltransferase component of viral defense system
MVKSMEVRSQAQIIEMFHLLFLRALTSDRQDWFVLKGGANIRYFFDSPRYSNDIDLDFHGREAWQVGQTVDMVLGGPALRTLARQARIEIAETSAPKQTDTTRRWKIGLGANGHANTIRTKIEFSDRNGGSDDISAERVPDSIVGPYGLAAPLVAHYGEIAAIEQKIAALALRSETKARDIFDLDLLLRRHYSADSTRPDLSSRHAAQAAHRALEVPYESFMSEVAPFLETEIADLYDEADWDQMRSSVAIALNELGDRGTTDGAGR